MAWIYLLIAGVLESCFGFGFAHRRSGHDVYAEPVAVLHDRMSRETEAGLLAPALLEQLGFRIRSALMRLVAALLTMEVHPRVTTAWRLLFVFGPEALHARPAFNQGSVSAEVLIAHPALTARQLYHSREEDIACVML